MPKRILQGTVVSDKNEKTVVVRVERRFTHPVMKKTVRMTKKYKAHDENNAYKVGDQVFIQEIEADFQGQALDRGVFGPGLIRREQVEFWTDRGGAEPVPLEEKKAARHDSDANKPRRRG